MARGGFLGPRLPQVEQAYAKQREEYKDQVGMMQCAVHQLAAQPGVEINVVVWDRRPLSLELQRPMGVHFRF